jgi:Calpain family cysteine protease
MTLGFKGVRFPGPLGAMTGSAVPGSGISGIPGGRIPGPLSFKQVDLSKNATKATKPLAMPPPTSGSSTIIRAKAVDWKLAPKTPQPEDVVQGELANCPVAAILAAMAHTANGRTRIDSMITEFTGTTVKTTFTAEILKTLSAKTKDDSDYKPPVSEITSQRYFSVKLGSKEYEVSDVFYVEYSDGNDVKMVYMKSPNEALWPCVIEKAYATLIGSYQELDDDQKHKVDEFWPALTGAKLQGFVVDDKTDISKITDAAKAAKTVPTIGASRDDAKDVLDHHGFAILGMNGGKIEMYDPHGDKKIVTPEVFRKNFQRIYFGNL